LTLITKFKRTLSSWLRVKPVENVAFAQVLARELDRGEAEAIVLAIEMGADRILLDERDARQLAKALRLPVTGVLGILLSAYNWTFDKQFNINKFAK
jgi:uncharacterized protein